MRLAGVEISGYGRIKSSSFSADRKLTAVLGPNEAGKSTLLRSLLALNDESPIPFAALNRTSGIAVTDVVVTATYHLDESDIGEFSDRSWASIPSQLIVRKRANGALNMEMDSLPQHTSERWAAARRAVSLFINTVDDALAVSDHLSVEENAERESISGEISRLGAELDAKEVRFTPDEMSSLNGRIREQLGGTLASTDLFEDVVSATADIIAEPDPAAIVESRLRSRRPRFELFGDADRQLRHEYSYEELQQGVPRALENFMSLAGQSLQAVIPDPSRRTSVATAQDSATETLEHVFQNAWKQHPISVKLGYETDRLIVLVRDRRPGGQTIAFDERSDGLRTFVALTAFLSTRGGSVPPILLIDEAESGLHWDAQADLISVLQSSSEVGQIIYTTHSPGCLPQDLGTGIIFVQPDPEDSNASRVRRDFWSVDTEHAFGASPILFMMGAGAAAFSRVRRAVVTEGPSDMLLLPTLFRAATKLQELDFQVVPGISTTSKELLAGLDQVGVRVTYLVDGDAQGAEWTRQLAKEANVEPSRVLSLPPDTAVEDLFDRDYYVGIFLKAAGRPEGVADLSLSPGPLKPQLEQLCSSVWQVPHPTAVDIAERILSDLDTRATGVPDHHRVKLSPNSGAALRKIHSQLMTLLNPVHSSRPS
ncbi:AAA family ATPase [Herbiconiux sp. P16]|uniref:AAA family ATPase n=1 Tax=Herbiconiux wuyangfengii TaxID=3342794 RepID=UPI0035BAC1D9